MDKLLPIKDIKKSLCSNNSIVEHLGNLQFKALSFCIISWPTQNSADAVTLLVRFNGCLKLRVSKTYMFKCFDINCYDYAMI